MIFDIVQLPRLKHSLFPIKSSSIRKITGGNLKRGFCNVSGSLKPLLDNNNISSSSNFSISSNFSNFFHALIYLLYSSISCFSIDISSILSNNKSSL